MSNLFLLTFSVLVSFFLNLQLSYESVYFDYYSLTSLTELPLFGRKYRFACQCPVGVSGPHCQWGGVCTKEHAEGLCGHHGACRLVQFAHIKYLCI